MSNNRKVQPSWCIIIIRDIVYLPSGLAPVNLTHTLSAFSWFLLCIHLRIRLTWFFGMCGWLHDWILRSRSSVYFHTVERMVWRMNECSIWLYLPRVCLRFTRHVIAVNERYSAKSLNCPYLNANKHKTEADLQHEYNIKPVLVRLSASVCYFPC